MPLTLLHAGVGAAAGAAVYAVDRFVAGEALEPKALGRTALLGALAGALPDILEPPTNRFHRKFFHSVTFLSYSIALFASIYQNDKLDREQRAVSLSLVLAYMSHLLLDSRTPMSLPLVF